MFPESGKGTGKISIILLNNVCLETNKKLSLQNMGKGSLWRVEQQYKQNLIQALTRSAYHPGTAADDKFTSPVKQASRPTETYGSLKVCQA